MWVGKGFDFEFGFGFFEFGRYWFDWCVWYCRVCICCFVLGVGVGGDDFVGFVGIFNLLCGVCC